MYILFGVLCTLKSNPYLKISGAQMGLFVIKNADGDVTLSLYDISHIIGPSSVSATKFSLMLENKEPNRLKFNYSFRARLRIF